MGKKVKKKVKIYEGKAKIIYATDDPNLIIQYFKDDATAFNAEKKGTITSKGILNNNISCAAFELLSKRNIPNHFIKKLSDREMLVHRVDIIPIELVVRNRIAGSLAKRMGHAEGGFLTRPITELYYKRDDLGNPMINEEHIEAFRIAAISDIGTIRFLSKAINDILCFWFDKMNISLIDFKLEFGYYKTSILLADEITPDGCRLWDKRTNKKLDKDRFRHDMGEVEDAYEEINRRVQALNLEK